MRSNSEELRILRGRLKRLFNLEKQQSVNFTILVVNLIRTLLHQLHILGILCPNYTVLAIFIRPLPTLPLDAGTVAVVIAFVTAEQRGRATRGKTGEEQQERW